MTVNVDVYRYTKKVGHGVCTPGNAHITSFVADYSGHAPTVPNKFHLITLTSGTNVGATFGTRFTALTATSLVMNGNCPYA